MAGVKLKQSQSGGDTTRRFGFLTFTFFFPPASAAVALLATTKQKLSKTESESLPPSLPLCRICRHGSEVEKIEVLLHDDDSRTTNFQDTF